MADDPQAQFAARIRESRQVWRDLVAEVGDRVDEPGPMGPWSFGELAGHLLGWRNRTIARIEAAGRGESDSAPPWPAELDDDDHVDQVNDWIREQYRGRPARELIEAYDESFERLAAAVEALPREVVDTPGDLPWLGGTPLTELDPIGHLREEHEASVRAWLAGGAG